MPPDIADKMPEKQLIVKMAGYLEKKGRMRVVGVRRWKKRWCVLEGKLLLYFKTQLEYSHHLSPCRGSVNMGLALSITLRGPCQLQIVTRSQIIIFRTKSKSDQDEWLAAFREAKNNHPSYIKDRNSSIAEMHYLLSNRIPSPESNSNNFSVINENHLRYGRSARHASDRIPSEVNSCKRNDIRYVIATNRKSSALRKSESDNRISFYRELHGLVRTETITAAAFPVTDKESCRSRSLSYESIYFKPQEKCLPIEPMKYHSCRELMPTSLKQMSKKICMNNSVSKRMSRSVSFFQKRCEDSDSDDYDYIEVESNHINQNEYATPMTRGSKSEQHLELPPREDAKKEEEISSVSTDEEFHNQEANVDVIYVNNDRKMKMFTSESESDLILEYGIEQTVETEDEPPPLPIKKKHKHNDLFDDANKRQYQIIDGVYVFKNGSEEVIYDVPIPHGKLIKHIRQLTITASMSSPVKRYADCSATYHDSLEPSAYETMHMTPDSLEISAMFPTYKRWSNDSGFNNYEEQNSLLLPDHANFEDSLEPAVIAMINHDRKIWQNVPNINSTDYFR